MFAERLLSGEIAGTSAKVDADMSLVDTFVTLMRQQNKQRSVLVQKRGYTQRILPSEVDDDMLTNDCVQCKNLCFLTMVIAKVFPT